MGDRGQVLIEDTGVYLYTHWGASDLLKDVKRALSKKWRWDDPEYLGRIIFDEMIDDQQKTELSFGIGTEEHGDIWRLIKINCKDQIVEINDYLGNNHNRSYPFNTFIKAEVD